MIKRILRTLFVLLCFALLWPFLTLLAFVLVAISGWQGKKADLNFMKQ